VVGGAPAAWAFAAVIQAFAGALRRRDPEKLKLKRAKGAAAKRLRTARDLAAKGRTEEVYAEIMRALQQFVKDRLGVPALGLVRDDLGRILKEQGAPGVDVERLVGVLHTCETARFMPGGGAGDVTRVLEAAEDVVNALDAFRPKGDA
jgi:hypothetical protein